ncbi:putative transcriptional regulator, Nlp [Desulfofarcimen acetoxidans DSM 771]|jgi:lambda repressor-like predicted transcriptional regulator|uniref:Putative transcriptional regulator, Nlp n=1 Tax=Desulfofarcimen acetoxidans (strain ATCC 49208 / DSM 771 / KCTC 5769 / VKM B-1644 / 5575) TaxID=485916 RepID=C8W039_DESAS|nr:transcriptional regulator [Desulfofarcimen acetoxidans]ACV65007.1 putative transcriptional regulator, Nlp [Desulfofarcimen acetoxidans DSM 771]
MGKGRGLTPREIRALMVLKGIKIVDIAKEAGVTPAYVHHAINSTGRNRGYRIRPYIAEAIGKTVKEIWPDGAA